MQTYLGTSVDVCVWTCGPMNVKLTYLPALTHQASKAAMACCACQITIRSICIDPAQQMPETMTRISTDVVWRYGLAEDCSLASLHNIFNFVVSSLSLPLTTISMPNVLASSLKVPDIPSFFSPLENNRQFCGVCVFHIRHHHVYGQSLVN